MNNDHGIFRALYYPYSRLLYETDLKRAVLVFDEILFVDPLSADILYQPAQGLVNAPAQALVRHKLDDFGFNFLGGYRRETDFDPITVGGEGAADTLLRWYQIAETYTFLNKEGIIRLVPSASLLEPYQAAASFAILRDLCRYELVSAGKLADPNGLFQTLSRPTTLGWQVHASRLPDALDELVQDDDMLDLCYDHLLRDGQKLQDYDGLAASFQEEWSWIEEVGDEALNAPYHIGLFAVLNQALILSEDLDAFLITDDPFAHRLLLDKYSDLNSAPELLSRDILARPTPIDQYRLQSFVLNVVSQIIPDTVLSELDITDIVLYRNENAEALRSFRDEMVELAADIRGEPYQTDFDAEILRLIDSKISPRVRELDEQLKVSYNRLFGSVFGKLGGQVAKGIAAAIPTVTLATFMGITPAQIALLASASLMSAVGMVLPDIVKFWQDKAATKRNGISYLVNFRNQLLK